MHNRLAVILLIVSAPAALADVSQTSSSSANGAVNLHDRRDIARHAPIMPAADAVAIAVKRVPGKVLAAEIETDDGIRTWQIDILADKGGKVRLWLNAANGDFLKMAAR